MSWGAVAGAAVGVVGSYVSGRSAANSAESAAGVSADAQMAGLDYLKESEELPMFYRDQALQSLAAEYGLSPYTTQGPVTGYEETQVLNPEWEATGGGLPGKGPGTRNGASGVPQYITERTAIHGAESVQPESVTDKAMSSPLYQALMSQRSAGEESIMRNAGATGRLRGGANIGDLADYNTQLENQALLSSYQNIMGGLSSLAGAQGYAPQIANQYNSIGQTQAAGQVAGATAMQEAYGGIGSAIGSGVNAYFNRPEGTV